MRLLEIILLALDAILILLLLIRQYSRQVSLASSLLVLLVLAAHLVIEGFRWQMVVAYFLTALLVLAAAIRSRSPGSSHSLGRLVLYSVPAILAYAITVAIPVLLPVPKLPLPTGPYQVGTTSYYILDSERQEIYGDNPGGPRELMLQLWYPAVPGEGLKSAAYFDDLEIAASVISDRLNLPGFFLGHLGLVKNHALADAQLNPAGAPYPLILFSHGLRGIRVQNTSMFVELASQGYIIASVDHTYDSVITIMPDGRAILHHAESVLSEDESPAGAAQQLLAVRVQDLEIVLDFLREKSSEPENVFYNGFRFDKVGVMGHSTGGGTAIQFCAKSDDCKAIVALDSWLEPVRADIMQRSLTQPSLFINAPEWLSAENQAIGEEFFNLQEPPSFQIAILGTNHYNFTDIPLLSPVARQLGLAGSINGSRSVQIINGLTLNFFNQYLDQSADKTFEDYSSNFSEIVLDAN